MLHCWSTSPDDRPSFEELHVTLQAILNEKDVRILLLNRRTKALLADDEMRAYPV